jgi:large subunit ribosomal protein L29
MKAKDLRERTTEDLRELEASLSADRFQNRFKNFTNRLDDTSIINKGKRDLARVKLILAERALGVPQSAPTADKPEPKKKPAPVEKAAETAETAEPKKEKAAKAEKAEKPKAEKSKAEKPKAERKSKTAKKETE